MCSHAVPYEQVMAYAADELEPLERARVAEHLTHCSECQATVLRFRMVKSVLNFSESQSLLASFPPPAKANTDAKSLFRQPAWKLRLLPSLINLLDSSPLGGYARRRLVRVRWMARQIAFVQAQFGLNWALGGYLLRNHSALSRSQLRH